MYLCVLLCYLVLLFFDYVDFIWDAAKRSRRATRMQRLCVYTGCILSSYQVERKSVAQIPATHAIFLCASALCLSRSCVSPAQNRSRYAGTPYPAHH